MIFGKCATKKIFSRWLLPAIFGLLGIGVLLVSQRIREGRELPPLPQDMPATEASLAFDHTFAVYQDFLSDYIHIDSPQRSLVKYAQAKDAMERRQRIRSVFESVSSDRFYSWSENQQLAFLINFYNYMTIELIIEHYPVESIKDIGSILSTPWKQKFFYLFGEPHDLDFVEHEMIRGNFFDPRIHFALVCASHGCPPLQKEAFLAEKLDAQLESVTRSFLRDGSRNWLDVGNRTVHLSKIFSWYEADFLVVSDSLPNFVAPYMTDSLELRSEIVVLPYRIAFASYDWTLNDHIE